MSLKSNFFLATGHAEDLKLHIPSYSSLLSLLVCYLCLRYAISFFDCGNGSVLWACLVLRSNVAIVCTFRFSGQLVKKKNPS